MRSILLALAFLFSINPARAQTSASANSYIVPQVIQPSAINLTGSPGGSYTTLYTGATNGSKCFGALLNHNDQATTHLLTFRLVYNTATTPVTIDYMTYTTVIGLAGNTLSSPVNLMSPVITGFAAVFPIDQYGNQYFYLKSGDQWQVQWTTAITGGDRIAIATQCADFK